MGGPHTPAGARSVQTGGRGEGRAALPSGGPASQTPTPL